MKLPEGNMGEHGIEAGEGTIGTPQPTDRKCDCGDCREKRFLYCADYEQKVRAVTKRPNAPTTLRLQ